MTGRKCAACGAPLTEEDVMKLTFEDGSAEVIPFTLCPKCFTQALADQARKP
jgi:hypothetical protein